MCVKKKVIILKRDFNDFVSFEDKYNINICFELIINRKIKLFVSSDLPAYVRKNSENVFKRQR